MDFKSVNFKAEEVDEDSGVFKGYAATWDLDKGNDIIVKGAFSDTLKNDSGRVKILWQHSTDKPIGIPTTMKEDDRGLYIEGKISDTSLGKDAKILLNDGVIDKMSIGFMSDPDFTTVKDGVRYLEKVDLYEFSLVTWPMNDAAVVTAVKELKAKEIERVLREAGLSKSQATCLTNNGLKALREAEVTEPTADQLAEVKAAIDKLFVTTAL